MNLKFRCYSTRGSCIEIFEPRWSLSLFDCIDEPDRLTAGVEGAYGPGHMAGAAAALNGKSRKRFIGALETGPHMGDQVRS